ncbi:MAG: sulfurtransferase [Burkholderiales bacterium]|nr:sulfurtransferase [Burkholderiales bacterium]
MFRTLISTADLDARLAQPDLVICDVRHDLAKPGWGRGQYDAGHLPGAVFVHLDHDLSGTLTGSNGRHPLPTPESAATTFGRLGIGPGKQVIAYDQAGGAFAARLWWMLQWLGFEAAAVLDGGYAKWIGERRVVSADPVKPVPARFAIKRVTPTVNAAGVMASLARQTLVILDARAPERFRGEQEPLDPVAGHIPGARNRPYTQNLTADGTFKHPTFLRAEFGAVLDGASEDVVVHQCGSGVTACHNILAMEVAGLHGTRLYPGSWSEWSADPARPVEVG